MKTLIGNAPIEEYEKIAALLRTLLAKPLSAIYSTAKFKNSPDQKIHKRGGGGGMKQTWRERFWNGPFWNWLNPAFVWDVLRWEWIEGLKDFVRHHFTRNKKSSPS